MRFPFFTKLWRQPVSRLPRRVGHARRRGRHMQFVWAEVDDYPFNDFLALTLAGP